MATASFSPSSFALAGYGTTGFTTSKRTLARSSLPASAEGKSESGNGVVRNKKVKDLTLHFGETSVTLPMNGERAKAVCSTMDELIRTLREKATPKEEGNNNNSSSRRRLKNVEYSYSRGEDDSEGVSFELFCNPNAFANAFQAKVLVTVTNGSISLTSEAPLTTLKADVDQFLQEI